MRQIRGMQCQIIWKQLVLSCVFKFFLEGLLAELKVEQECVTSVLDRLVVGNCLVNRLSNINTQHLLLEKCWCSIVKF